MNKINQSNWLSDIFTLSTGLALLITLFMVGFVSYASAINTSSLKPNPFQNSDNSSLSNQFETLGDNKALVERAAQLDHEKKLRIVQNRLVDRNNRFEFGLNYGINGGGDSYLLTQNTGVLLEYHINPRWSIGYRYQSASNQLTQEGKATMDRVRSAQAEDPGNTDTNPTVDYPLDSHLLTFSYYPIYGKINLFDQGVAHFDLYTILGGGQIKMKSGVSDLLTAGIGSGFWFTSSLSLRAEVRYLGYRDFLTSEKRSQQGVQGMFAIGIIL